MIKQLRNLRVISVYIYIFVVVCIRMAAPPANLRISCWNSRGLTAAIPYLREIMNNSDIVCISEHWLHNNCLNALDNISNDFYSLGRSSNSSTEESYGKKRGTGGVAIFWRKCLPGISPLLEIGHDRFCGIRIQLVNDNVLNVYSVYMPASGFGENLSEVLDELSGVLDANDEYTYNLLCGDFNGDMGQKGGIRGKGVSTKAGETVLEFMDRHRCHAANLMGHATGSVNTFSSHNGSSTIDYAMIPDMYRERVVACHVESQHTLNTSDHYPIQVELNIERIPGFIKTSSNQRSLRWDKLNQDELAERYAGPLTETLVAGHVGVGLNFGDVGEIDRHFDKVVDALRLAAKRIPTSKFARHLKPYWSDELTHLKREKIRHHRLWKSGGRPADHDHPLRVNMRNSKKLFNKTLRVLSRRYDDECIAEAAASAEIDRNKFWRLFRNKCGRKANRVHAIKNSNGEVVYDISAVLEVWRGHFSRLCVPKHADEYDHVHFERVTQQVSDWANSDDVSPFLVEPVTFKEMEEAIKKLHLKKAPGHDGISAEHLRYGGPRLCQVLCNLYNMCIETEYIPCNFRQGVQVPLYKGKNTCPLKPDNYRGITLLSSFNKILEMLVWRRIEVWWVREGIVSELQGACRKGSSCIHTALTLQETIAEQCEGGKKVFVAYFDVSKAFASVWIDGLFFQLYELGIRGSLWRLLYKTYKGFNCRVRIGDRMSEEYPMLCGIHQGGFLSLIKYISFINSLLIQLKQSGLCCTVMRIQTTPLGYADDLATCTLSGNRMKQVVGIVEKHGQTWRYSFNAGKSAIMVYGESKRETAIGSEHRMFSLGEKRVKETGYYDHVGIKACLKGDTHIRTEEKVKKARKVLNMATCMGIKRGGLNMATCCLIYWTVVIPTLCFGCEIWILKQRDIAMLVGFQKYAAKRIQRFHPRSYNATSTVCLGWLHIVRFINVKKILFIRTIFAMDDRIPIKQVFKQKVERHLEGELPIANPYDSPINDLINVCHRYGMMGHMTDFINGRMISKSKWRELAWRAAWVEELDEWGTKVHETQALRRGVARIIM